MAVHHRILALPGTAKPHLPLSMAKVRQINLHTAVNRHILLLLRHTSKAPLMANLHRPLNMALMARLPMVASNTVKCHHLPQKPTHHTATNNK
jgi:hypothetical protein